MCAVATGKTISCCLGKQYRPMLSLSFLDVYAYHYVCNSHFLKPVQEYGCSSHFLKPVQVV